MLVGLKSDLRNSRKCIELLKTQGLTPVTREQGESVARQMGATYMECSSKEMTGVNEIFEVAIDTAVTKEIRKQEEAERRLQYSTVNGAGGMWKKKSKKSINCPVF